MHLLALKRAESMGCKFSSKIPDGALNEVFLDHIYDVEGFVPPRGSLVIDVGASYGDTTVWWSKFCGARVMAFEPLKDIYSILEEDIRINALDVAAYDLALGNGERLPASRSVDMLNSASASGETVATKTLDSMSPAGMWLLKVDVEGFECQVLEGAKQSIITNSPKIIVETHSRELRKKCTDYLEKLGYKIDVKVQKSTNLDYWMDEVDILFCSVPQSKVPIS